MREKEPQFTVTDRRKFTAEGELREGEGKASESSPRPPLLSASSRPRARRQAATAAGGASDLEEPEAMDGEDNDP